MEEMWKTIIKNDIVYLIKLVTNPRCKFSLTDLKGLWVEELENDEISKRFEELNPLCQTADVVKELTGLFDGITSENIILKVREDKVIVDVKCIVDDFEIKYNWVLVKQLNDLFFKEITLNLINNIVTLENQREHLCYLLEKKDKEKEEYIREFGEISRDFLKTIKFKKEEFVKETNNTMGSVLANEMIVNALNEKYGAKIIKRECNEADDKTNTKKLKKYVPKFLKK